MVIHAISGEPVYGQFGIAPATFTEWGYAAVGATIMAFVVFVLWREVTLDKLIREIDEADRGT